MLKNILNIPLATAGAALSLLLSSNTVLAGTAYVGTTDEHYEQLGIQRDTTEQWEDGMRTSGGPGTYEWWYTDAEFEGGVSVVVAFYTKNFMNLKSPSQPIATFDIKRPGFDTIRDKVTAGQFVQIDAETSHADVNVEGSYLRDLGNGQYEVKYISEGGDIVYTATMTSTLPAWRPQTGHLFFEKESRRGKKETNYFAWFVAQPSADVTATLTMNGKEEVLTGTGYHDHNWGDIAMSDVINHWYWGRATVDGYNIISADIISEEEYGYKRLPLFMVGKDGEIIEDGTPEVFREETIQHEVTHKFMDNKLTYVYQEDSNSNKYSVEWNRIYDTTALFFSDMKDSLLSTIYFNFMGIEDATYVRVMGDVNLKIESPDQEVLVDKTSHKAIWEQMHFGSNKEAIINE